MRRWRDEEQPEPAVELKDAEGNVRRGRVSRLVEEMIQAAQARGAFDNLPGKGKPLDLEENPFAPDAWLVNNLLKHNRVLPEWIELDKQIRAELEWLARHPGHPERARRIELLNRQIDRFNLMVPSSSLQRPRVRP